eukprot:m.134099 g.134099  ORF g.134099 m.134099 type:complete len:88 (-) comp9500_c0_seq1:10-273(-)
MAAEAHCLGAHAGLWNLESQCRLSLAAKALTLVSLTALESTDTADLAATRCEELQVINRLSFQGLDRHDCFVLKQVEDEDPKKTKKQ